MQGQSPPPYTPIELGQDVNKSSYNQSQLDQNYLPSSPIPASQTRHYASSSSAYTIPYSHSQSHLRKRNGARRGSRPGSELPSPTNSDSEIDDGPMYASTRVRQSTNGSGRPHEDEGIYSSSTTSTDTTTVHGKSQRKWTWRHWLFALAAGVVGLSDGRDREKEEKVICTTPGWVCAGETETETDEPSRHLPTARIIPSSESSSLPPSTLQQLQNRLIPLLFEFSRLLSIVPALFGTIWNLYWMIWPPSANDIVIGSAGWVGRRSPPERADFFVAALWSILTGYQCLALTTGLLTRWQAYYPPLPTLIRLLALQGICWPATQITLTVLEHVKRPVVCWCVIGTTTCASRSVQIWVTSNISVSLVEGESARGGGLENSSLIPNVNGITAHLMESLRQRPTCPDPPPPPGSNPAASLPVNPTTSNRQGRPKWRWTSTERRWDWKEVGIKCVLPAGIVYFIMAWVGEVRREWAGC